MLPELGERDVYHVMLFTYALGIVLLGLKLAPCFLLYRVICCTVQKIANNLSVGHPGSDFESRAPLTMNICSHYTSEHTVGCTPLNEHAC